VAFGQLDLETARGERRAAEKKSAGAASVGPDGADYPMKARGRPPRHGSKTMEQFLYQFWWLIFPIGFGLLGAYNSFLGYRRQKDAINLLKAYADKGQEPPEALLKVLQRPLDEDGWDGQSPGNRQPTNYWSLFGLFAALGLGFLGASYFTNLDGGTDAFLIVAFVMGAVAVWALISALTTRRDR
jgi:hypothetical protein